jgi:2-dehydro-3-deoxygluconokinase
MTGGAQAERRFACFGECMVELRSAGPGLFHQSFAGDSCNTAIYLSRLRPTGWRADYVSAVGGDPFAAAMRQAWRDEGLADDLVREVPGRSTGLYAIHVDERGERRFSYWRDTSAARAYFDVPATPLENALAHIDALYLSGISVAILDPSARDRLLGVVQRLKERGALIAWDNNYRSRLWDGPKLARATMDRFCALADVALLSMEDALAMHESNDAQVLLEALHRLPCAEVVVKRGGQPALVRTIGAPFVDMPVQAVARPVDTTAAGDAFNAAYLAARLRGQSASEAAAAGNRLAATVVMHPGAIIPRDAMPLL